MPRSASRLVADIQAIWTRADAENRELTDTERSEFEELTKAAEAQHQTEKSIRGLGDIGTPLMSQLTGSSGGGGLGDQFVRSAGWKKIADPDRRPQQWSTGPVALSYKAGTLLEGAGAPGAGQGGGLLPAPTVAPGVVETLFEPLSVASRIPHAQASNNTVRYIVEGTATSAAAGVAEGAAKPASDLALSTIDEPVKKIATVITVSDELLEDTASLQSYLNSRLSLFVKQEEERQILRGGGTNDLIGIFGRSGVNTYPRGTVDNNAVAVLKAALNTRGSAGLDTDTIVMHPTNWLSTRLLTDTTGQFFGGGPFGGAYGGTRQAGITGDSLWGIPVALSSTVGAGTCLVGSFGQGAQVFSRGALTVEASNSHASYFQQNLVMLRAELRLALCVYRPASFTQITGMA